MGKIHPVKGSAYLLEYAIPAKESAYRALLEEYGETNRDCLVPYTLEKGIARSRVVFDTTSLVPLPEYLAMPLEVENVCILLESLMASVDEFADLGLGMGNLMPNFRMVYMNAVRGRLSFLLYNPAYLMRDFPLYNLCLYIGKTAQGKRRTDVVAFQEYVEALDAVSEQGAEAWRRVAKEFIDSQRGSKEMRLDEGVQSRGVWTVSPKAFYRTQANWDDDSDDALQADEDQNSDALDSSNVYTKRAKGVHENPHGNYDKTRVFGLEDELLNPPVR